MKKNKLENVKAQVLHDSEGKEHVVMYEDKKQYSITNMLAGPFFFIRSDGSDGRIEGYGTIDDIDEKEYKRLKKSESFKMGTIVEEKAEIDYNNYNSLNEKQLNGLFKKHGNDIEFLKNWISKMTSDFSVSRMKDYLIEKNLSAVLSAQCDLRLSELKAEYEQENIAPIDALPKGV